MSDYIENQIYDNKKTLMIMNLSSIVSQRELQGKQKIVLTDEQIEAIKYAINLIQKEEYYLKALNEFDETTKKFRRKLMKIAYEGR